MAKEKIISLTLPRETTYSSDMPHSMHDEALKHISERREAIKEIFTTLETNRLFGMAGLISMVRLHTSILVRGSSGNLNAFLDEIDKAIERKELPNILVQEDAD